MEKTNNMPHCEILKDLSISLAILSKINCFHVIIDYYVSSYLTFYGPKSNQTW